MSPRLSTRSARKSRGFPRAGWRRSYAGGTTHYDTLGLTPAATHAEVRQAYIDRALRHHPDRHGDLDVAGRAEAERRMQQANAAWAVLGDREARAAYDAEIGVVPEEEAVEQQYEAPPPGPTPGRLRRLLPLLVVLALLAAFLVFTAYAGSPRS